MSDAHGQPRDGTADGRKIGGAEGGSVMEVVIVALLVHGCGQRVALIRCHGAEPDKAWAHEAARNGQIMSWVIDVD